MSSAWTFVAGRERSRVRRCGWMRPGGSEGIVRRWRLCAIRLGVASPAPGENFYALAEPNGRTAVFGVLGNTLVAASEARRAAGLVAQRPHTVARGAGSAVVTVNARELAGRLLAQRLNGAAGLLAPLAVSSLRDLTGVLNVERGGLDGHLKLTIVR